MNDFISDIMSDKKKKYGAIALVVVIILCILFGIHEHNKPISPVVGSWSGNDINLDGTQTGHNDVIKLQTYNNHNFNLKIDDGSNFDGKYDGKWEKTDDVNNNGDPIYELKLNDSDALGQDGEEYFTLAGKDNVLWIGPNDNQHFNARLHKVN